MTSKLYIDCQVFQTPAWDRGMGRYTMSLLKTLYSKSKDVEYVFIFSTNLPQKENVLETVAALCPGAEIIKLDLFSTNKVDYRDAAEHNKGVLNQYLGTQDNDVRQIFMLPSLFQEPTASVFPDNVEKCLIYYDAIPLLYYHRYLNAINYDNYLDRHEALYAADKIFTISQTIADDLAIYYGMENDNKHIVNIDGACIDGMFDELKKPKLPPLGKYILLTTSDDIRKNNHSAVKAFDQLRTLTGTDYKLVVTSHFDKARRKQLENLAENIVFTGNLSDAELAWLYKNAEAVLFTSEYEGLGLPVLEAVKMGKKVICSNIPVFREISEKAFYFFDPLDISDITHKLYKALRGDGWVAKERLYKQINQHYSWGRSASIVYDALVAAPTARKQQNRPKIAILAPTPDGYSAIGKVVQELHQVTAKYFEVHYYFENRKEKTQVSIRPNYLDHLAPCFSVEDFNAQTYRNYDAVIYHVGNSEYHFQTILGALHLPGIVVFHDTVLREAFGEMVRQGFMLEPRLLAEARLDEFTGTENTAFLTSLANNQLAGIVHSEYARNAIEPLVSEGITIQRSELPVASPIQNVQSQQREIVHIGLAGILSSRKGLDIIKELATDPTLSEKTALHVFGFSMVDPESIEELKAYKNVRLTTDLSDQEYQMQLGNLDILVNYRMSYRGETSLTVLEAMRYGCVAVVNSDLGWFGELPGDAVAKVADQAELIDKVRELVSSPAERERIGSAAKAYVKRVHDPEMYVKIMYDIVNGQNGTPNQVRAQIIKKSRSLGGVLEGYKEMEETKRDD